MCISCDIPALSWVKKKKKKWKKKAVKSEEIQSTALEKY